MAWAGHDATGFEGPQGVGDPLIVSRDDHLAHEPAPARLINHVLHEGLAGIGGENFGGKTGGSKAGGNDDGCGFQTAERLYRWTGGVSNVV